MDKPFAITLNPGSSLANHTGSWRTSRPLYLDRLPPGRAVIGTSNLQLDLLTERFQTRFQSIKLAAPSTEEIAGMLRRHWPVDKATSLRIAVGSGGCVRAALADLETWLDVALC